MIALPKCAYGPILIYSLHCDFNFANKGVISDPLRLCKFLLSACLSRGVQLHQPARALSVSTDMRDEISSIRLLSKDKEGSDVETDIPCTSVVITSGAWTPQVFSTLFPAADLKIPVSQLAGHSLVLRSPRWTLEHEKAHTDKGGPMHAVFTTDPTGYSPELFSRTGAEIYIAGLNDPSLPLPKLATDRQIDPDSIGQLKRTATRLLGIPGQEDDLQIVREGLCFRPVTRSGRPIIGRIDDKKLGKAKTGDVKTRGPGEGGVFIAAGHGPWGISLGIGTGCVVADMVAGKATSADVTSLAI